MRTTLDLGLTPAEAATHKASLVSLLGEALYSPTRYLGSVAAGGTLFPTAFEAANKQSMTRARFNARDRIDAVMMAFTNFYVASTAAPQDGTERAPNGGSQAATVFASIEDESGNITQMKWNGASSGTIAAGQLAFTDLTPLKAPIASGAKPWWRAHFSNQDGRLYSLLYPYQTGDGIAVGATTPNLTMGGSVAQTTGQMYTPVAIIGYTNKPTVGLLGDSRVAARAEVTGDASLNFGCLGRSIGPSLAYINISATSDRAMWAKVNYTQRAKLLPYVSHLICELGIGDLIASQTSAQLVTSLGTFYGLLGGKPIWQTTLQPVTTGAWTLADGSDQTVFANEAQRVVFNNAVRAGIAGTQGHFDLSAVVELAIDGGKWKAPNYTSDGTHELKLANRAYQAAGIMNPGIFTR